MDGYLASDRAKLSKTGGVSPAPSAYPGTQNQWPAGYGVQTQSWPQATQAQGQQWPATYAQQVTLVNVSLNNHLFFLLLHALVSRVKSFSCANQARFVKLGLI